LERFLRKSFHVFPPRRPSDDSTPDFICEAPHASPYNPDNIFNPISPDKLASHEGYDPGALVLMRSLRKRFPSAWFVIGKVTRLYAELNRTFDFCCPEGTSNEERAYRFNTYCVPYKNAVLEPIEQFVERNKFPLLFNIHTYEPKLDGYKRKLFAVLGDQESVLVNAFARHLCARLADPDVQQRLSEAGVQSDSFLCEVDINKPYNVDRRSNPLSTKVISGHYALPYGFPWATLEVRNDVAHLPIIHNIVGSAIDAVLNDPEAREDLEIRRSVYFEPEKLCATHPRMTFKGTEFPLLERPGINPARVSRVRFARPYKSAEWR
jgi:predicted N-formylglutamate amidohydrolase